MKYPDDFDLPVFPAGRKIAVSRFMATWTMVVFALIISACVLLVLTMRAVTIKPYIIELDSSTGNWNTITLNKQSGTTKITPEYAFQEYAVSKTATDWFTITNSQKKNSALWKKCNRTTDCKNTTGPESKMYGDGECALYCEISDSVYTTFTDNVMPDYLIHASAGDEWRVIENTINVIPLSEPNINGGTWQVYLTIKSKLHGQIQIVAYTKVARNTEYFDSTFGFYVAAFNAFRIN